MEEMKLHFDDIIQKFQRYYGEYYYFYLLILSIILILFLSKKRNYTVRTICFWLPIISMLVVFNPLVHKILNLFVKEGDDYWRFFWIIPMVTVIAYSFTRLIVKRKYMVVKIFVACCACVILFFSGKLVYSQENFQKVNNYYKMPDEILDILIKVQQGEEKEKKVMAPISVVPWVRQFDGTIKLEYGRKANEVYRKFIMDFDQGVLNKYMKKYIKDKCNYIVINNRECDCNFESYGYNLRGENDFYKLYVNENL